MQLNGEKSVSGIKDGFNDLQSVIRFDSFNMFFSSTCLYMQGCHPVLLKMHI